MRSAASILVASCILAAAASAAAPKPNIIVILTDDQGYGDLARHGHPLLETPHLDRFHDESVRFENFYVSPSCSPTRAALLTGMHEFRCGVTHTVSPREELRTDVVLLPQLLGDAGYRTGFVGKWHLGGDAEHAPESRGFDWVSTNQGGPGNHFDPDIIRNGVRSERRGFREDLFFDEAMAFIDEAAGTPFFCYLATYSPHAPYAAPEKDVVPFKGRVTDKQAAYLGMISNIDQNVGRLMAFLRERKLDGNTLVVFMNDNGVTEGLDVYNAGMRGCKCTIWQGGSRAMSFWRWPSRWKPHAVDNLAAHLDILPTLCELAGARIPERLDGFSLVPLLESASPVAWHPGRMLFQHVARWPGGLASSHKHAMCAVRRGFHLLLRSTACDDPTCRSGQSQCATLRRVRAGAESATYTSHDAAFHWGVTPPGRWVLFDVRDDPACRNDLSASEPELAADMAAAYDQWWDRTYPEMIAAGGDRAASTSPRAGAGVSSLATALTLAEGKPAPAPSGKAALFPRIDTSGDKLLTRDEVTAFYQSAFTRKDADGDGALGPGEHPAAGLKAMDKDNDGKVSPAEWQAVFVRQFERSDADKDGKLTPAEWEGEAPAPVKPPEKPARDEKPAPAGNPKDASFARIDTDGDGFATRDEFLGFYKTAFTRKDADGNGALTTGEHPEAGLKAMDKDNDGKVVPAEWNAVFERRFKTSDKNGDGKLSKDET